MITTKQFQHVTLLCPMCLDELSSSGDFHCIINNYESDDGKFDLYECLHCNVQFWVPFRNPGADWYENCKQNLRHRSERDREHFLWMAKNRIITSHFLKNPPHVDPRGLKLLDVGCGTGGFLIEAQKLGYDVFGVDFDEEQIKFARSFGLESVYVGDVFSFLDKYDEEFDVITGFEIIEHLDKPREFLNLIYRALKPGGYICLSTPNRLRIGPRNEFWDFPYHHLTRWSKGSLENFVLAAGYKGINIKEAMPTVYLTSKISSGTGLGNLLRKFISRRKVINERKDSLSESNSKNTHNDSVAKLGFMKDKAMGLALLPISYLLFALGVRGEWMYLVAKK